MPSTDYKNKNVIDEAKINAFLKDIVNSVEHSSNAEIEELKALIKLFKKNVPFSRRKYAIASLVRNEARYFKGASDSGSQHGGGKNKKPSPGEPNKEKQQKKKHKEKGVKDEDSGRTMPDPSLTKTIFIGAGSQRKVSRKDIISLLTDVAKIEAGHIGRIKVLSSYSFADILTEDCEKAIAALNGYEYRGQALNVDYARRKGEGKAAGATGEPPAENRE